MNPNSVKISLYRSVEEAPKYDGKDFTVVDLTEFAIVRNGTKQGNPTIDIVFVDAKGNKFVSAITGRLFKTVASAIGGTNESMT